MLIERQLENDFIAELKSMPELSASQVVGSREVAAAGDTKSEEDTKATIVAVACGFRQNDAFSLSPITMQMSITVMTRTELDPTSEGHSQVIEAVADLLSQWHKDGNAMTEVLSNEKFFAGELRMDGGTARTYDSMTQTWSETINFSIRGSEKLQPLIPTTQYMKLSDGRKLLFRGMSSPEQLDVFAYDNLFDRTDIVELSLTTNVGQWVFSGCTGLVDVYVAANVELGDDCFQHQGGSLQKMYFTGRTMAQVQAMDNYPWGLTDTSVIVAGN